ALRTGAARLAAGALSAAGVPRALGPLLRRAAVRASRTGGGDPAPYELVRRVYGTSRSMRAILMENACYRDVAAELIYVRRQFVLPEVVPIAVIAAGEGRRWLERQAALAVVLGAELRISSGAGHLVMLDRPEDVAAAALWPRA
ncbi:alpha/beta hydrolase, partial [Streptomyces sp. T-3]|nr:alpha/beta hydrolase [Streptomyces sp. T-3]